MDLFNEFKGVSVRLGRPSVSRSPVESDETRAFLDGRSIVGKMLILREILLVTWDKCEGCLRWKCDELVGLARKRLETLLFGCQ
jgi:hypothetical protein